MNRDSRRRIARLLASYREACEAIRQVADGLAQEAGDEQDKLDRLPEALQARRWRRASRRPRPRLRRPQTPCWSSKTYCPWMRWNPRFPWCQPSPILSTLLVLLLM